MMGCTHGCAPVRKMSGTKRPLDVLKVSWRCSERCSSGTAAHDLRCAAAMIAQNVFRRRVGRSGENRQVDRAPVSRPPVKRRAVDFNRPELFEMFGYELSVQQPEAAVDQAGGKIDDAIFDASRS